MALKVWTAGETLAASDINNNFTEVVASARTLIPNPAFPFNPTSTSNMSVGNNTIMYLGQIIVPFKITANKLTFRTGAVISTSGTVDFTLYNETGESRLFSVTSALITTAEILMSISLSTIIIQPGVYWIAVNSNDTTSVQIKCWSPTNGSGFTAAEGFATDVASKPVMTGTLTITAGTPPLAITPTSVVENYTITPIIRLDN